MQLNIIHIFFKISKYYLYLWLFMIFRSDFFTKLHIYSLLIKLGIFIEMEYIQI
jgi:hypothetical protein